MIMALSCCHLSCSRPSVEALSSCPFVCFFNLCCVQHTLFFFQGFLFSLFCHNVICSHFSLSAQISKPTLLTVFFLCSIPPSIYPSTLRTTLSISLPLISLRMLWLVSLVSVRPVITAVSSLGKNKVILCSRHYKRKGRNKRKEPSPKKKRRKEGDFLKRRGVNWKKSSKLGTHLFMLAVMHCHVWVITTIDFSLFVIPFICTAQSLQLVG